MNVTAAGVDIHGILTFHISTTSTDVLDIAVHLDIAACSGKVLNVTIDLNADNVTLSVLSSDGVPIDGLTIGIPATVNLLDGLTLDGIGLVTTSDVDRTTFDDSTLSCGNRPGACTMNDRLTSYIAVLFTEATG